MALRKRRSESDSEVLEPQTQADNEAQPESFDSSNNISQDENSYSQDVNVSASENQEEGTQSESAPVKLTVRPKRKIVKVTAEKTEKTEKPEQNQENEGEAAQGSQNSGENHSYQKNYNQRYNNKKQGTRQFTPRSQEHRSEMPVPTGQGDPSVLQPSGEGTDENASRRR